MTKVERRCSGTRVRNNSGLEAISARTQQMRVSERSNREILQSLKSMGEELGRTKTETTTIKMGGYARTSLVEVEEGRQGFAVRHAAAGLAQLVKEGVGEGLCSCQALVGRVDEKFADEVDCEAVRVLPEHLPHRRRSQRNGRGEGQGVA